MVVHRTKTLGESEISPLFRANTFNAPTPHAEFAGNKKCGLKANRNAMLYTQGPAHNRTYSSFLLFKGGSNESDSLNQNNGPNSAAS